MITAHLAIIVQCEGDNRHCSEYFKREIEVTDFHLLDVPETSRIHAEVKGWQFKDGKDLCPKCKDEKI